MAEPEKGALSEREEQVLLHATHGLTDKEIANQLGISTATVLTYWMRIRNKLGGSNRAELVASSVRKDAEGEIQVKQTENQLLLGEILRRMQAEDAVRESEERYKSLFNGSNDWILVYPLDEKGRPGRLLEVNDIACERLGYSRDVLQEMTILDLADRNGAGPLIDDLPREKRVIFECLLCSKDKTLVPTEISASLFSLKGKPTVQCICRDLTARKEAEHALRDAREAMDRRVRARTSELEEQISERKAAEAQLLDGRRFAESLIESSLDGILAFDTECRYTVWNPVMERLSGMKRKEVFGRVAFEVFPFLKEIGEDAFFERALRGEVVTSTKKEFVVPSTGRKGFFEGYYSPLRDESGAIIGGLAVIHEMPDQKIGVLEKSKRATLK